MDLIFWMCIYVKIDKWEEPLVGWVYDWLTDLFTTIMEQAPCWGATRSVLQVVTKRPARCGAGMSLPWAISIQLVSCQHFSYTSTLILSSYLHLFPKWSLTFMFPHQICVVISLLPTRATCPTNLIPLYWSPNNIWWGVETINCRAPHYASFCCRLLCAVCKVPIYSTAPYCLTPSFLNP